jgi:hypothetical protein
VQSLLQIVYLSLLGYQVGATKITQTLFMPISDVASVSIQAVGSDGITTFLYFASDPVTAIGVDHHSYSF